MGETPPPTRPRKEEGGGEPYHRQNKGGRQEECGEVWEVGMKILLIALWLLAFWINVDIAGAEPEWDSEQFYEELAEQRQSYFHSFHYYVKPYPLVGQRMYTPRINMTMYYSCGGPGNGVCAEEVRYPPLEGEREEWMSTKYPLRIGAIDEGWYGRRMP